RLRGGRWRHGIARRRREAAGNRRCADAAAGESGGDRTDGNQRAKPCPGELHAPKTRGPVTRARLARPLSWRRPAKSARKPVANGVKSVELEADRRALRFRVMQQLDAVADACP